jgi:hypothetical protein
MIQQTTKKWLLARIRTIRTGIMLVVAQVDEIGIELSEDKITPEVAVASITALEEMRVHFAAHIFSPAESEAA